MRTRGTKTIEEIEVLRATIRWLCQNGWKISAISIPKGQGMDSNLQKVRLKETLSRLGIGRDSVSFNPSGPDIIANCNGDCWKIECKGFGIGKRGTLRNNFDRAVASTVSYYDRVDNVRLGLAIPDEAVYSDLLVTRLPPALRERINLWIFLYLREKNDIEVYEPGSRELKNRWEKKQPIWEEV